MAATRPALRPLAVSQYDGKLYATGTMVPKDAKGDVRIGVRKLFGGPSEWDRVLSDAYLVTTKQREAVYDAGAVALVALRHSAARLVIEDYRRATTAAEPMGAA